VKVINNLKGENKMEITLTELNNLIADNSTDKSMTNYLAHYAKFEGYESSSVLAELHRITEASEEEIARFVKLTDSEFDNLSDLLTWLSDELKYETSRPIEVIVNGHLFQIIIEENEDGYFAQCPELQGCFSQGIHIDEALSKIKEAIELYLETTQR
jgi:hypothetical protein